MGLDDIRFNLIYLRKNRDNQLNTTNEWIKLQHRIKIRETKLKVDIVLNPKAGSWPGTMT